MPAPPPGDVILRNLGMSYFHRVVAEVFVELIVFLLLTLFSSPVAMIAGMKQLIVEALKVAHNNDSNSHNISVAGSARLAVTTAVRAWIAGMTSTSRSTIRAAAAGGEANEVSESLLSVLPGVVMQNDLLRRFLLLYTPVLLLSVLNAAIPTLLRAASTLQGYTTKSTQELSVFRKTVFYVLLNSVILPSLAIDTASELALALLSQSSGGNTDSSNIVSASSLALTLPLFERVFSGDMAFFLCNLIVQLTGTTTMLSLLRLPDALRRWWRTKQAVTPLERAAAKCAPPFDYAYNYAATLVVVCMSLLFGAIAPVIWLFALPFVLVKHAIDVFNLRFVHPEIHMEGGALHRNAATLVVFWCVLSELVLAATLYLRGFLAAAITMLLLAAAVMVVWVFARALSRSDKHTSTTATRHRRRRQRTATRRRRQQQRQQQQQEDDLQHESVKTINGSRGGGGGENDDNQGDDESSSPDRRAALLRRLGDESGVGLGGVRSMMMRGSNVYDATTATSTVPVGADEGDARSGSGGGGVVEWLSMSVLNLEVSSMSGSSSEDDDEFATESFSTPLHYGSFSSTVFGDAQPHQQHPSAAANSTITATTNNDQNSNTSAPPRARRTLDFDPNASTSGAGAAGLV